MEADIIASASDGTPVLLVEVNAHGNGKESRKQLRSILRASDRMIHFGMIVDPSAIQLFDWDGARLTDLVQFKTKEILERYDADFAKKRVFESYLTSLVEAWLRDLAYSWKAEPTPGLKRLRNTGLLEQLSDGTTTREAAIRGAALS